MIFVIPVSAADFDKLPKFVEVLKKFGGLRNHQACVIPTQEVEPGVHRYIRPLFDLFESVEVVPIQTPEKGPWPYPCNQHFKSMVLALSGKTHGPRMWLELDSCPLKSTWADDLQLNYYSAGKPFAGVVRDTSEVPPHNLEGSHLVGFAIYPENIEKYSTLWRFPSKTEPFDIFMRWDVSKHSHNTPLIQHEWGCRNFQSVDGKITGESFQGQQFNVRSGAVILHGVKDDSLVDLILGNKPATAKQTIEEVQSVVSEAFDISLEEAKQILQKAGYIILDPDNPSQLTEKISTADVTNGAQGEPATGPSRPHETKSAPVVAKKRGRPKLAKNV